MDKEINELKEEICFYEYCCNAQEKKYSDLEKAYNELLQELEHLRSLCKLFRVKDLNK